MYCFLTFCKLELRCDTCLNLVVSLSILATNLVYCRAFGNFCQCGVIVFFFISTA